MAGQADIKCDYVTLMWTIVSYHIQFLLNCEKYMQSETYDTNTYRDLKYV